MRCICKRSEKINQKLCCTSCLEAYLTRHRQKLVVKLIRNEALAELVETRIRASIVSLHEAKERTTRVKREIAYVKGIALKGQSRLDELRTKTRIQRETIDAARRTLHIQAPKISQAVQNDTESKNKRLRSVRTQIIAHKQKLVRETFSLFRMYPLNHKNTIHSVSCWFEIGGLPFPSLLKLKGLMSRRQVMCSYELEYPPSHITCVVASVSHLVVLISGYLEIRLKYDIVTPQPEQPSTRIRASASSLHLLEMGHGLSSEFSEGLAYLLSNVLQICYCQGVQIPSEEMDIGRILGALVMSSTLGQASDHLNSDALYLVDRFRDIDIRKTAARIQDEYSCGNEQWDMVDPHD